MNDKVIDNGSVDTITTTNLSVVGSGPMCAPVQNEENNKQELNFSQAHKEGRCERTRIHLDNYSSANV